MAVSAAGWADGLAPQLEAGTVFVWGQATELVLRDGTYDNPISRLVWEIPPSAAIQLGVDWPWSHSTSTYLELQGSIPGFSGTTVDEDWNTGSTSQDLIYGRSSHTDYMTARWSARLEQRFRLPDTNLTWSLGTLYRWAQWEAWNGSGHYEYASGGGTSNVNFSGPVLAYRIAWFIPYVGAGWTIHYGGWTLTPGVQFSPFSWGWDRDDHNYASDVTGLAVSHVAFMDDVSGGLYGKAEVTAEFPQGSWSWGARLGWEIDWGARGSTTETYTQQTASSSASVAYDTASNAAGAWFHEATLSIFVRN
jgi:outer membrane protease